MQLLIEALAPLKLLPGLNPLRQVVPPVESPHPRAEVVPDIGPRERVPGERGLDDLLAEELHVVVVLRPVPVSGGLERLQELGWALQVDPAVMCPS